MLRTTDTELNIILSLVSKWAKEKLHDFWESSVQFYGIIWSNQEASKAIKISINQTTKLKIVFSWLFQQFNIFTACETI